VIKGSSSQISQSVQSFLDMVVGMSTPQNKDRQMRIKPLPSSTLSSTINYDKTCAISIPPTRCNVSVVYHLYCTMWNDELLEEI